MRLLCYTCAQEAGNMRIAIVDDEESMREQLQAYIERYAKENAIAAETVLFSSGNALLQDYQPVFDILIFDIDMPGMNGLDTARTIRKTDENTAILFITNIAQYAINGYEVDAVDYIIKPIGYYDFAMKFKKAVKAARRSKSQGLVIETVQGPVSLTCSDILYVEVIAHYLIYHTQNMDYRVRASMKEHENLLKGYDFARCHKSYLINLRHLSSIRTSDVLVEQLSIPLGRAYKTSLMSEYMQYLHR